MCLVIPRLAQGLPLGQFILSARSVGWGFVSPQREG